MKKILIIICFLLISFATAFAADPCFIMMNDRDGGKYQLSSKEGKAYKFEVKSDQIGAVLIGKQLEGTFRLESFNYGSETYVPVIDDSKPVLVNLKSNTVCLYSLGTIKTSTYDLTQGCNIIPKYETWELVNSSTKKKVLSYSFKKDGNFIFSVPTAGYNVSIYDKSTKKSKTIVDDWSEPVEFKMTTGQFYFLEPSIYNTYIFLQFPIFQIK